MLNHLNAFCIWSNRNIEESEELHGTYQFNTRRHNRTIHECRIPMRLHIISLKHKFVQSYVAGISKITYHIVTKCEMKILFHSKY